MQSNAEALVESMQPIESGLIPVPESLDFLTSVSPAAPVRRVAIAATAEPLPSRAAEQERLMLEHLPTVRYVARQIHERLPQHACARSIGVHASCAARAALLKRRRAP